MTPDDCYHLQVDTVLEIHREAIIRFGGTDGIRDRNLFESALAAPQASFGGESRFSDIFEIAAAYLFYLCSNHPFLDGNKRVALGSCIVFLRLNGIDPPADGPIWEKLTLDVASGKLDRAATAALLRALLDG